MAVLVRSFRSITSDLEKAVKKYSPSRTWPVYRDYDIVVDDESGESFVVAPIDLFELDADEVAGQGQRTKTYRGRDPEQAALTNYAPLRTPELVVDLANLADNAITPEAVVGWAEVYGLLASSREEDVLERPGLVGQERISGFGCRESVSGFARAAGEVRTCLRTYGVLSRDEDLDLEKLSSEVGPLPREAIRPEERKHGHERAWLFGVLGRMIQTRLHEHCYPQFNIYTRGGYPTGRYALSWGFHSLLGAIWIQMAWLLENQGSVKFCRLPDCRRVITFEFGEPSYETSRPGPRQVQDALRPRFLPGPRLQAEIPLSEDARVAWVHLACSNVPIDRPPRLSPILLAGYCFPRRRS
jgi:hypothetical protein